MSFAAEMMITVPSGAVQISELRVADLILGTGRDPAWEQYEVKVAEATGGGMNTVFYLQLENGKSIVATLDQWVLVPGGTLQRIEELGPNDEVLGGGRQPIRVVNVAVGQYNGKICAVSTSAKDEFDGHLIEANGVIVADLELQMRHRP